MRSQRPNLNWRQVRLLLRRFSCSNPRPRNTLHSRASQDRARDYNGPVKALDSSHVSAYPSACPFRQRHLILVATLVLLTS